MCDCDVSLLITPYFQSHKFYELKSHLSQEVCSFSDWQGAECDQCPRTEYFLSILKKMKKQSLQCVNCPVMNQIHKYEICVVLRCVFKAYLILNGYC